MLGTTTTAQHTIITHVPQYIRNVNKKEYWKKTMHIHVEKQFTCRHPSSHPTAQKFPLPAKIVTFPDILADQSVWGPLEHTISVSCTVISL